MMRMIARLWRGVASTSANADAYQRHVTMKNGGGVEFLVITLWDSMDAIRKFAGDDPEAAVVEPEARAVLSDYDNFVRHCEVHESR